MYELDKPQRTKILREIKADHAMYIDSLTGVPNQEQLNTRFSNLQRKLRIQLRKEFGSSSSVKTIPNLARLIFGLHEDILRLGLPSYSFAKEKGVVNIYIREYLEDQKQSKYSGECASYGETLLNCYLDVFITLTVLKTPKKIGTRPAFLVNPLTGSRLELDVLFEDFRLAFEFQGELHYQRPKIQQKDKIKLKKSAKHKKVLIPVNISQLHSQTLQELIVNSLKDYLGLHDVLVTGDPSQFKKKTVSKNQLLHFSKAVQRIYLSKIVFHDTLAWLDGEASAYIKGRAPSSPVSASVPAPRFRHSSMDLDLDYVYRSLKYVKAVRQQI